MTRCAFSTAVIVLLSATLGTIGPCGCVETSSPNKSSAGGQSQSMGGQVGVGGTSSDSSGGCPGTVDTATDGTAGTTSTGPYVWKNVAIRGGGFVDGIVFSSVAKDLVYARTDMGGAYRWDPTMNGWVALTDWVSRSNSNWTGIESIAPDPVDSNIVYMAGGTYMTSGNGVILRSTDRGAHFSSNAIAAPMGGNVDGRSMGERLAIDPNLTSKLYFASRSVGLMLSTDSGANWSPVTSFPVLGGATSNGNRLGLSFVTYDPKSDTSANGSSTIYVGVADVTAGSNLYVSKDGGATWQLIAGGPTAQMPHHGVLDASGTMYLAYNSGSGPNSIASGGVWKYETSTGLWTDISPPNIGGNHGFGGVTVDAQHSGTVMVSTIDWWQPDEPIRTTDGGANWIRLGKYAHHNPNGAEWLRFGKPGCDDPNAAGWMGSIQIDPFDSAHAIYGTGQGIWSSHNANGAVASDVLWTFENRNLEQTAVTDMVPSVNGAFLSCVGDIDGMRNENLDQPSPLGMYRNPVFGSCSSLDYAAQNPDIVARAGSANSANAGQLGAYSKDNGKTWTPFATFPVSAGVTASGGKLAVSADGTSILWSLRYTVPPATTSTSVVTVSSDFGATWTPVTGLPTNASIAADRKNPNKFYGFSYSNNVGTVYVSADAGKTFTAVQNSIPFLGRGPLRVPFGIEGDVWLVASSNASSALYHSTESGANFAAIASVQAAYALGFGKAADGTTYPAVYLFGSINGVTGFFRSDDQGVNWTRINDDDHQFSTAGYIAGDEKTYGRVYIGNNGRGIIYGDPAP